MRINLNIMKKFRKISKDVIFVSRLTGVTKKKLRIFISVVLSNLTVLSDILIILFFASILTGQKSNYSLINDFLSQKYLLPIVVLLRFLFIYIEQANMFSLKFQVEKNLKNHLINEVYEKGNYSISDANYYIGTLSGHIGYFYQGITSFLNSIIQVVVYASFLIFTDINTIVTFTVGLLILFVPTKKLIQLSRKYMHEAYLRIQESNREVERIIQNIFLIKILETVKEEFENFDKTIEKVKTANFKNNIYGTLNSLTPNFLTVFTISLLIVFFEALENLTLEFLGVTLRLVQTLGTFNKSLNMVFNSHVHLETFLSLEQNKIDVDLSYYEINEDADFAVNIENLSFKFFNSEKNIFENLNLKIEKNKHTIITGPNGSGKSTLLGLISKVFYPHQGTIISNSNNFGYVGVTPLIFDATLRENFLYGNKKNKLDEEIIALAKEFNLYSNDNLDLNKRISNKELSSGQMQKISFIRALLSDVDILILDESTSNLDSESRKLIFEILKRKNITVINSTHNHEDFSYDCHLEIQVFESVTSVVSK
tara:strand:- start:33101 stop:34720 length:1620 start_codon:yes stop_codon:yes gene_type:complete